MTWLWTCLCVLSGLGVCLVQDEFVVLLFDQPSGGVDVCRGRQQAGDRESLIIAVLQIVEALGPLRAFGTRAETEVCELCARFWLSVPQGGGLQTWKIVKVEIGSLRSCCSCWSRCSRWWRFLYEWVNILLTGGKGTKHHCGLAVSTLFWTASCRSRRKQTSGHKIVLFYLNQLGKCELLFHI